MGYDTVKRYITGEDLIKREVKIKRFKCRECKKIHRDLPQDILPYKQYSAKLIKAVVEGDITCETLGYEDYPCEHTMKRWIEEFTHRGCFYK